MIIATEAYAAPLVEPIPVSEVYIDGIALIENAGPNMKFWFYSSQRIADGRMEDIARVIVAKFVMPTDAVANASLQAMAATGTRVFIETH